MNNLTTQSTITGERKEFLKIINKEISKMEQTEGYEKLDDFDKGEYCGKIDAFNWIKLNQKIKSLQKYGF